MGECYLYLAKSYPEPNFIAGKALVYRPCHQALRLFLNVKPCTSNFPEMQECIEPLIILQENNGKTISLIYSQLIQSRMFFF
jgi:hypothetical protein